MVHSHVPLSLNFVLRAEIEEITCQAYSDTPPAGGKLRHVVGVPLQRGDVTVRALANG